MAQGAAPGSGGDPAPGARSGAVAGLGALLRALPPAVILPPLLILLGAALAAAFGPPLPASLAGLQVLGPGLALALAATVALWFNRGRASVFAVSLLLAWGACEYARELGGFSLQAVYTALVVLVPVNLLACFVAAERGVLFHHNYRWGLLLGSELLVVGWIASAGRSAASGTAWYRVLDHWALRSPPTPLAGRILFAAAFVAAVWRAWPRGARTHVRPLDAGLACATAGLFLACEWQGLPGVFALFMSATGLVLLVAVMQESHRLAFRDELTGLPSRRALEERLHALGPEYAVAMVDVDHFKKFNDTHGHDIGDQVLRLVAARLAQVGGGGRAFRYGGEEFCVLFNGLAPGQALAHIEATRASVQAYRMAVRSEARPADRARGESLRAPLDAPSQPQVLLSVTVSAGVAGKRADEAYRTPYEVIKSADEALYRAKGAGRNRVSD